MRKLRPIKTEDQYSQTPLDEIVYRPVPTGKDIPQANGKTYVMCDCPFCDTTFKAYLWSVKGIGKRCPNCKGFMNGRFEMMQWRSLSNK